MGEGMSRVAFLSWLDSWHDFHEIDGFSRCYVREQLNWWLNEMGGMAGVW